MGRHSTYTKEIGDKMCEIYALYHPVTNIVFYIGKANNSEKRLKSHIRDSKRRDTPVYAFIREIMSIGLIPKIEVLEKTNDWEQREIEIIAEYKEKGFILKNVAKGGNQPFCSNEVRANNGRNVAKKIHGNDKLKKLWLLKKNLSHSLSWLDKNGFEDKANQLRKKLTNTCYNV